MPEARNKKGISGSTLKLIAMLTMLIDHIGASPVHELMVTDPANFDGGRKRITFIVVLYYVMRCIGRLSFPIIIFLLTEGYMHTKNRWAYLARLFLFALVSEVPFDLAFNIKSSDYNAGKVLEFTYQNVYFTLVIGLLTIIFIDAFWKTSYDYYMRLSACIVAVGAGCALAWFLKSDYDAWGVFAIVTTYILRRYPVPLRMAGAPFVLTVMQLYEGSLPSEVFSFLNVWPAMYYNGKRGWNVKWAFYFFYPVHLLTLGLIKLLIL